MSLTPVKGRANAVKLAGKCVIMTLMSSQIIGFFGGSFCFFCDWIVWSLLLMIGFHPFYALFGYFVLDGRQLIRR